MKELGPIAKLLVESAREGLGPDDAAIARMHARVSAAVASAPAATTAGVVAAKTGGAVAMKIAVVAAIAGVATGSYVLVASPAAQPPALPAPRLVAPSPPVASVPAVRPLEPARVAPPPPASDPAPIEPSPRSRVPARARPAHPVAAPPVAVEPPPPAPPPPAPPSLAREVAWIDDATSALRAGHAESALAAIVIYQRETLGRGQLAEEAAAIELEALCATHSSSVAVKLADFDRSWPGSPERARITAACH